MDIAVFISGHLTRGLETPGNGEGRWGIQLARMLALKGHKIDCISNHYSSLGGVKPPDNINVYTGIPEKQYDIAIYVPWEHVVGRPPYGPCTDIPIKAEWYIHCSFGWGRSIPDNHTCYNNKHVLAFPYIQHGLEFPKHGPENPFMTFPLPIPIYDQFKPINIENRNLMAWTSKEVFHPYRSSDDFVMQLGIKVLKSMSLIAHEYGLGTVFVGSEYLLSHPSKYASDMGALHIASELPHVITGLLPRDHLFRLFEQTRITALVGGLLGSFGESIACGAVPITYDGYIHVEAAKKAGIFLDQRTCSQDDIYQVMKKLMNNDFYISTLNLFREELKYYSYDYSYSYFTDMVDKLGRVGV